MIWGSVSNDISAIENEIFQKDRKREMKARFYISSPKPGVENDEEHSLQDHNDLFVLDLSKSQPFFNNYYLVQSTNS